MRGNRVTQCYRCSPFRPNTRGVRPPVRLCTCTPASTFTRHFIAGKVVVPHNYCRLMPNPCDYLIRRYTADQSFALRRLNLSKRCLSSSHAIFSRTGSKRKPPLDGDERDDMFSAKDGSLGAPRRRNLLVGRPAHLSWVPMRRTLRSVAIPIFTHI